jgi:hypothetical protein
MSWTLALVLALCLGPFASMADSVDELSVDDRSAIRAAIEGQIAAFRADDAPLAFSFATPTIQDRFGDASRFIAMVRRGYQPVYRPRQVEFTDLLDVHGQPAQQVVVVGPDNDVFNAYYLMEQQPDGVWRISGCILRPLADRAI